MSTPFAPFPGTAPEEGETYIQGKSPEMARDLLAAAEALGHDVIVVRTTQQGFIVPSEVWDYADEQRAAHQGLTV